MALTEHYTGDIALTAGTASTIDAAITTAGLYNVQGDASALANPDEVLWLIVLIKPQTGNTERELDRFVVARGGGTPDFESPWYRCQASLKFQLLQVGGTGRTIEVTIGKIA